MRETVTYLDMTARDQLVPAAPARGLTLEPLDPDSPLVVGLQAEIGAPYGWKCASRTEREWTARSAQHPDRIFWLFSFDGEPAGLVAYDLHPATWWRSRPSG